MEPEIIVRGEGRARALPDRAVLNVTIEDEAATRDDAYGTTTELATRVDAVIADHQGAIDRVITAALVVHPRTRWRKGENVRTGWRASRTTIVEIVDFTRLGDLIAEVVAAGAATAGPFWQLEPTDPVRGEARRLAAEDTVGSEGGLYKTVDQRAGRTGPGASGVSATRCDRAHCGHRRSGATCDALN